MTSLAAADVPISYGQVCVFHATLKQPYNDWGPAQTRQGFSWRNGSVSFASELSSGICELEIELASSAPDFSGCASAVVVPFDVVEDVDVEVGSIMSGFVVSLPPGRHALYFIDYGADANKIRLVFVRDADPQTDVLVESANAQRQANYCMAASPA